jgi:hypothetical protein
MAIKYPIVMGSGGKFEELQTSDTLGGVVYEAVTALNDTGAQIDEGTAVNLYDDTGTLKVRKASAEAGAGQYECHGFAAEDIPDDATGTIKLDGIVGGLTSIVHGSVYYLSATTAGAITVTPPSVSTTIVQKVGVGISSTEIAVQIESPTKRR